MPQDNSRTCAVIGSGIAGLASAWLLSRQYRVTLYEKNDYVGGHTNTRRATFGDTSVDADTGFMVFNHKTYPNLCKLFGYLGVKEAPTDMSFGISLRHGEFEMCSDNLFVQKKHIVSPAFWRMVRDIVRFNREAPGSVAKPEHEFPLDDLLHELQVSDVFVRQYLLPMAGAIWSTTGANIREYPAKQFIAFCSNHGLLHPNSLNPLKINSGRLQWYTPANRANEYVEKILSGLDAEILLETGVSSLRRYRERVEIRDSNDNLRSFDMVVCASHPDQTLRFLQDPTPEEREALGAFVYSKNTTILHRDTGFMMHHTTRWPSWTYAEDQHGHTELSYYMNRLQHIDPSLPVIVTLNPSRPVEDKDVFYRTTYEHPRFSVATADAQAAVRTIQGKHSTWYAGAWLGHGFHEDGLRSAIDVARACNVRPPWEDGIGTKHL